LRLAGDNPHHDNGVRIKDEPIRTIGTCIGDTVNLASRIEEYTKEVLRPLLIDENTRKGLPETFKVEDLGKVFFKGKNQAVNVFAVEG
jgi:adenylate cyclase